uniref:Uncharacterized protein n=1 Tax=Opuntia streptacantha TaxID=393608 RepID=A0A7C9AN89_OPUST
MGEGKGRERETSGGVENVESDDTISRLSDLDKSPSKKLSALLVQPHAHHDRPSGEILAGILTGGVGISVAGGHHTAIGVAALVALPHQFHPDLCLAFSLCFLSRNMRWDKIKGCGKMKRA